jgi:anti-anti-sigma factor
MPDTTLGEGSTAGTPAGFPEAWAGRTERPSVNTSRDKPAFEVGVESIDGRCVVVFRGELDMDATDDLWRCLDSVRSSGQPVVVDLSGTTFMDSAGIKLLLRAYTAQGQVPEAITLRSPTDAVTRVLDVTGVSDLFRIESAS